MRIYDFEGKKNISGERIREARLKLRLSQSDLAARVLGGVAVEYKIPKEAAPDAAAVERYIAENEIF